MGGAWGQIFGQDDSMNRAERRARDKEWARFTREQKRTRARSRKIEKKED